MKRLPETIKRGGFTYTLVERTGHGLLYAQSKDGHLVAYEVFRRLEIPTRTRMLKGTPVTFEASERWPHAEAFGRWAWAFMDLARARERLLELGAVGGTGQAPPQRGRARVR